jgi:hypothetical protein
MKYKLFSSPAILLLAWSIGDAIRKYTLNSQLIYILQLLIAAFFILKLFRFSLSFRPLSKDVSVLIILLSFLLVFSSLANSLNIMASLSALIFSFPPLLLFPITLKNVFILLNRSYIVFASAAYEKKLATEKIVFFVVYSVNTIVSLIQSTLPANAFLNVGRGLSFDGQITTAGEIAIRSPGLFSFITSNANFYLVSILLLPIFTKNSFLRLSFLLSGFIIALRSGSRYFILSYLITMLLILIFSYGRNLCIKLLTSPLFLMQLTALLLSIYIFLDLQSLSLFLSQGIDSYYLRNAQAGGLNEGTILRFFGQLVNDSGGSAENSILTSTYKLLNYNPLTAFFGSGIGSSSPVYQFFMTGTPVNYLELPISFYDSVLLGESPIPTVYYQLGVIPFVIYCMLVAPISVKLLSLAKQSKHLIPALFVALLLMLFNIYDKPSTMFPALLFISYITFPYLQPIQSTNETA